VQYKGDSKAVTRKQIDYKVSSDNLKLVYTIKDSDLDEEDEEESKDASDSSQRQATVKAEICFVSDGLHVVEWYLKEGDRELFLEHYDMITDNDHIKNYMEGSKAF